MTHLYNDPLEFSADALRGLVAAKKEYLTVVHGGVVRAGETPLNQVAVVVGGGTGHYPAFAGWVGEGMAHGAVCGKVFASPSTAQVLSVAREVEAGAGVVLLFGNYAGDVLHFGKAAEILNAEGIPTTVLPISDDIASGPPENHRDRRGIAGDFVLTKVVGAAAAKNMSHEDVDRVARWANDRTKSLGVAFSGCTLPGAEDALFEVPEGQYALGLGVHGEPGISLHDLSTAKDVAKLLVDGVLAEEPEVGPDYARRAAVLVNGLGATKYEELFLLYADIASELETAGIEIVNPEVGEQITSLDMAGVSLTVLFLDEELEELWQMAADSPAFHRGVVEPNTRMPRKLKEHAHQQAALVASNDSKQQAANLHEAVKVIYKTSKDIEPEMGKLDSVAGDGDHGVGMVLGAQAAERAYAKAVESGAGASTAIRLAGEAWSDEAGGTSGALWGQAFVTFADCLSDEEGVAVEAMVSGAVSAARSFAATGKAQVGDKTMVDATAPFADTLEEVFSGTNAFFAWQAATKAAFTGVETTKKMTARKGRARTHGNASLGHPDPGAVSFSRLMDALSEYVKTIDVEAAN